MIDFKSYKKDSGFLGLTFCSDIEIEKYLEDYKKSNLPFFGFGGYSLIQDLAGNYWLIDDNRDKPYTKCEFLNTLPKKGLYPIKIWFSTQVVSQVFTSRFKGKIMTWEEYHKKESGLMTVFSEYSYRLVRTLNP